MDEKHTKLTKKQMLYVREANRRWNFKIGATRSGKTFVDLRHVIPRQIREKSRLRGLYCIIGVTESTIERNILSPMREIFGEEMVHKINNKNMCRMFNEDVYILGAEKACQTSKLRGASFKYVYGDEVAEWSREVFELLKSRMDKPYSRFDGTCNPEGPGHWLKEFIDREEVFVQYFHIDDNPHLDPEFVAELKKEYQGTMYYGRYIEGKWTAADGLIYPKLSEINLVEEIKVNFEYYVISIDYGIQNPTAMLKFGYSGGIWTVLDEFYYNGRKSGIPLTDEEYYIHLCRLAKNDFSNIKCVIIDPSAASFIQLIRRKGEFAVKRANNDVLNGIRNTTSALNNRLVKIHTKCTNLINELQQYSWEDDEKSERPKKKNDHACDALRYFVRTMKIS